ncbi:MAG: histidine kinase [bacterium]
MYNFQRALVLLNVYFLVNVLLAQNPISIHLTEKDGLPDIEFYDMVEDKNGFIWLACNNGLYRYDGREFKNYSHPQQRGLSVFNLRLDNQDRLWCTNVSGQFFYIKDDLLNLDFDASKEYNSGQLHTFNFFGNRLIANGNNFVFSKNLETNKIKILTREKKGSSFFYRNSIVKNDTLFLLKTDNNKSIVNYLTSNSQELKQYVELDETRLSGLFDYNDELFFQRTQTRDKFKRGLIRFNEYNSLENLPLSEIKLINGFFIDDNDVWFLTEKGVEVFSHTNNYKLQKKNHFFSEKFITKVIKDRQDNYWFSTLRNGVFVIPNIHINTYQFRDGIGNITAIEKVNDRFIYFGTTLGWLGIYDINTAKIEYIEFNTNASRIRHILYNKKLNDIYVATNSSLGSYIINLDNNIIRYPNDRMYFGSAKGMVLLNDGRLFSSLVRDHTLTTLSKGKVEESNTIKLRGKRVYETHYSRKSGTLYVANVDEFIAYDEAFDPTAIRHNNKPIFARSITETNDGIIWVSTFKDGVLAIKDQQVLKVYNTENGLLSNQPSYIKADENMVWITTDSGLQCLNPKDDSFRNLTQIDGIESFNINGIEIIDNTLWFSSNLGLFSFDKTKVFKSRELLNPYFSEVTIADSSYTSKRKFTVEHDDKRIKIRFNTNGFQSAENTQYQYKLKGLNTGWQNLTLGVDEVTFNSLEQGNYTFQLRTFNDEVSSEIQEIDFQIKGIFYEQWWFFLILTLIIGLVIWYYFHNKNKQFLERQKFIVDKKNKELENIFLKLESLRSQMNPHFIFNALNSIQDYILNNEKKLARTYLVKFSRLIRLYLEHSQKNRVSLRDELEALNFYLELEKDRFEDSFTYNIDLDNEIDDEAIKLPTFLIQPYVENAIKHGLLHKKENRVLTISFKLDETEKSLLCFIDDNGIGRIASNKINNKKTFKPKSFSSNANEQRIQLLNKTRKEPIRISIEDKFDTITQEALGTLVILQIPYAE